MNQMGKYKRTAIMLVIILSILSVTKDNIYADENNVGESETETYTELDENLNETVKNLHIPGMAVEIVNTDQVLFAGTYGNCDSVETPFLIGSMSKSFTAACIMQLVEAGKIELDQSISSYIDVVGILEQPTDGEKITVRSLLNQTSGLDTYQGFGNAHITDCYGHYRYANVNYGILSKIIESVSGMSYSDYVETHIFLPLDMQHSSACYDNCKADGLITGYRNYFGFTVAGEPDYPVEDSWSTVAAGYIDSSASDIGRYLQMYLRGGENVLQESSVDTMLHDNVEADTEGNYRYGMGWGEEKHNGELCYSHGGLVENFMSYMIILPEENVGIVILINANDYFVANNMTGIITQNIVMAVKGEPLAESNQKAYLMQHAGIDAIYLIFLTIALLPIVWMKKEKNSKHKIGKCIGNILLHAIFPVLLLCLPMLLKTPLWVVYYFVKDLFFVLVLCAALLVLGGGLKTLRYFDNRKKRNSV